MADSTTVSIGLATLTAAGWDVIEPNEGGRFGAVGVLTAAQVAALQSQVTSGAWRGFPSVTMRLRMAGTGTVVMDSATGEAGAGTVTTSVYTYSPVGTQVDDFAYPGDNARSIRITLTGTATCEVI